MPPIEFHNTGYGRTFFEHQLPQLIRALNRMGDARPRDTFREPPGPACETCVFFDSTVGARSGLCRRRPPRNDWSGAGGTR